jgi:hypothetical protein
MVSGGVTPVHDTVSICLVVEVVVVLVVQLFLCCFREKVAVHFFKSLGRYIVQHPQYTGSNHATVALYVPRYQGEEEGRSGSLIVEGILRRRVIWLVRTLSMPKLVFLLSKVQYYTFLFNSCRGVNAS